LQEGIGQIVKEAMVCKEGEEDEGCLDSIQVQQGMGQGKGQGTGSQKPSKGSQKPSKGSQKQSKASQGEAMVCQEVIEDEGCLQEGIGQFEKEAMVCKEGEEDEGCLDSIQVQQGMGQGKCQGKGSQKPSKGSQKQSKGSQKQSKASQRQAMVCTEEKELEGCLQEGIGQFEKEAMVCKEGKEDKKGCLDSIQV